MPSFRVTRKQTATSSTTIKAKSKFDAMDKCLTMEWPAPTLDTVLGAFNVVEIGKESEGALEFRP